MITLNSLMSVVIQLLIGGLILWLLWWLIDYCKVPEPFNKVLRVVLAIVAVIFIIGILLSLAGRPLIVI